MRKIKLSICLVLAVLVSISLVGCSSGNDDKPPKYIFYMIGDGFGYAQMQFAEDLSVAVGDDVLNMRGFQYHGTISTYSANTSITDSAAAATALATGVKTNNAVIALNTDGESVMSVMEYAKGELGYKTGIVTTARITHATPASFISHNIHRDNETEIADEILTADVDFLAGGGLGYFVPITYILEADGENKRAKSYRIDNRDLLGEFKDIGYNMMIGREGTQEFLNYEPRD